MGIVRNCLKKLGLTGRFDDVETPSEAMFLFFKNIRKYGLCAGVTLGGWQINKMTKLCLFLMALLYWLLFYTVYVLFPSLKMIELLAGFAILTMTYSKFQEFIFHYENFVSIKLFMFKVLDGNATGNSKDILMNMCHTIMRHSIRVFFGLAFGLGVYSLYPAYDLLVKQKLTLVSPLLMPFVDETTLKGYLILLILNVTVAVMGISGTYFYSCIFVGYVDMYDALVYLVEDDLNHFDAMCKQNRNQPSTMEQTLVFRNILMKLMDLARYNKYMSGLFETCSTFQVLSAYFGSVLLLFAYFATNYVGGVGGCVFLMTDLIMVCSFGQLLQDANERIVDVLYSAKWYIYDIKYQKDILFALNVFQNIKLIRVANLNLLNLETGLQVINNVYNALMVMLNFLEEE